MPRNFCDVPETLTVPVTVALSNLTEGAAEVAAADTEQAQRARNVKDERT